MNQESTKDNRVWHRGPPPFVSWWNASSVGNKEVWRWWDGEAWSMPCGPRAPERNAALSAQRHDCQQVQSVVSWNDYWPEGARVPRVAP